jgi:hypothetical protein
MKLKIFFQFHSLSTFYLLDLVSIFLLLFILFKIIYKIRILFFNFIPLQPFYLSDLIIIFLSLFELFKIIYKIIFFFQFPPPSSFSSISFGSYFFNKHEKILISCF